jgi:hypothetical protein
VVSAGCRYVPLITSKATRRHGVRRLIWRALSEADRPPDLTQPALTCSSRARPYACQPVVAQDQEKTLSGSSTTQIRAARSPDSGRVGVGRVAVQVDVQLVPWRKRLFLNSRFRKWRLLTVIMSSMRCSGQRGAGVGAVSATRGAE